jgi:hypothetical protein
MPNLGQLTADLRGLAGFEDVTEPEVHALLNEADREMCVRSGWTRADLELGPTVADQVAYALPSRVHRPLKVWVNGRKYDPTDEDTIREIQSGELGLRANGAWWRSWDANGVESVSIYPTPSGGLSVVALCVVYPASRMEENDDTPASPEIGHRALRDYAASVVYGYSEDNPELRQFHDEQFEQRVEMVRRLQNSRTGRGDVHMRIENATA